MDASGCGISHVKPADDFFRASYTGLPQRFESKLNEPAYDPSFQELIHQLWIAPKDTKILHLHLLQHLIFYKQFYLKSDHDPDTIWKHVVYTHRYEDDSPLKDPQECQDEFINLFDTYVQILVTCETNLMEAQNFWPECFWIMHECLIDLDAKILWKLGLPEDDVLMIKIKRKLMREAAKIKTPYQKYTEYKKREELISKKSLKFLDHVKKLDSSQRKFAARNGALIYYFITKRHSIMFFEETPEFVWDRALHYMRKYGFCDSNITIMDLHQVFTDLIKYSMMIRHFTSLPQEAELIWPVFYHVTLIHLLNPDYLHYLYQNLAVSVEALKLNVEI